ncbi:MAG: hypothetical protein LBM38_00660 [Clostridiales bacterium]|jgi:hypothetical protein|nr:hypothetical protein [Clostridiales bacterium]
MKNIKDILSQMRKNNQGNAQKATKADAIPVEAVIDAGALNFMYQHEGATYHINIATDKDNNQFMESSYRFFKNTKINLKNGKSVVVPKDSVALYNEQTGELRAVTLDELNTNYKRTQIMARGGVRIKVLSYAESVRATMEAEKAKNEALERAKLKKSLEQGGGGGGGGRRMG